MLVRQALQFPRWEYSFTTTPAFSVCSPLAAAVCSQTQKPQCGRRWAMLPAPFTFYGAIGVGRNGGERELAQFPEMSGSLGRARHLRASSPTAAGVTSEQWFHLCRRFAAISCFQACNGIERQEFSLLSPKNRAVKFPEWRQGPYVPPTFRKCRWL